MICHGDKCRQDAVLKRCNSIIQATDLEYYIVKKLIVLPQDIDFVVHYNFTTLPFSVVFDCIPWTSVFVVAY